jgi:hypothetical protein
MSNSNIHGVSSSKSNKLKLSRNVYLKSVASALQHGRKKSQERHQKFKQEEISNTISARNHSNLINLKVEIKCTNEKFDLSKLSPNIKIRDLKAELEFICGIPFQLQRLSYLDEGTRQRKPF